MNFAYFFANQPFHDIAALSKRQLVVFGAALLNRRERECDAPAKQPPKAKRLFVVGSPLNIAEALNSLKKYYDRAIEYFSK